MAMGIDRRRWLAALAALGASAMGPRAWAAPEPMRFAAAWEGEGGYRVGVLRRYEGRVAVQAALEVPTRAHGLWAEPGGTLLAAARRPGDWLVRLGRDGRARTWGWIEPARAFNGHLIASADGRWLYTTETDLETAEGLVGVRDAASLEKVDEWPTHGMDPHELLLDTGGSLVVANGGIPTLPETGRLKVELHRMDASLVRLDTRTGERLGQWRLADPRLSLRHMAWSAPLPGGGRRLGIALQAEHERAEAKAAAPLLAQFDGRGLRTFEAGHALAGYGGDIAFAAGRFAVSCPRAHGVALWHADGRWDAFVPLDEVCPLAAQRDGSRLWAGGRDAVAALPGEGAAAHAMQGLRLDNHWLLLA